MASRKKGRRATPARVSTPQIKITRTPPWAIVYYKRADGTAPALQFLDDCPTNIEATFIAVLDAVAAAPPPQFSGGGKWEAMHGAMGGYHEIRLTGPGREQFRLFCILENGSDEELARRGYNKPAIAVITGMSKPWRTTFTEIEYAAVRRRGDEHLAQIPRRIAT